MPRFHIEFTLNGIPKKCRLNADNVIEAKKAVILHYVGEANSYYVDFLEIRLAEGDPVEILRKFFNM